MQMVLRKYRLTTKNLPQSTENRSIVKVNSFEREFNMTQGHGLGDGI